MVSKDSIKRISALIYIRVTLITLLLGSLYVFRVGHEKLLYPAAFSLFIVALYVLTIIYAVILRYITTENRFRIFAYAQIIIDVIAETFLIYITGGIASIFSFLYLLSIISAGIVQGRRACYVIATFSSICYGGLINLQFYNVIENSSGMFFSIKDYLYNIFAHIVAFYLIAFLNGYLSEKLHSAARSLEERDTVLSDLKAFNKYIIESMPSGVFTTDLNKKIITFNSSAQDITKMSAAEVTGSSVDEVFPFLGDIGENTERTEGDMERDGIMFPVGIRLSPLKDSAGSSIGLIGVFQDLTELKAMEAEVKRKEKWAFIGELSASIAHELRNPLASLKGSMEMLRDKKVPEEHADQLMKIALSEMDRLNGIITDFLLYARPQVVNKVLFDLHQSLRDVITLLHGSEKFPEDVALTAELEGELMVSGDAKKLQQVFWNLCLNAVDAVSDGGKVRVYTVRRDDMVEISFEDTGVGIGFEEIEDIFYPFFTTKEEGTGLGLAVAQKIIEDHGGKIGVESGGKGKGSTFRVLLPIGSI